MDESDYCRSENQVSWPVMTEGWSGWKVDEPWKFMAKIDSFYENLVKIVEYLFLKIHEHSKLSKYIQLW